MTSTYPQRRRTPEAADTGSSAGGNAGGDAAGELGGDAAGELADEAAGNLASDAGGDGGVPHALAVRLARALQQLARGLPNPWDESTDYFHGFVAELPASVALDAESLRAALRIAPRYRIDLSPADPVLDVLGQPDSPWGPEIAGGFRQLATVMRATLGGLTRAFARAEGDVRVPVWLFGRTEAGALVGLRSTGTET